jgi:hypothetical protein
MPRKHTLEKREESWLETLVTKDSCQSSRPHEVSKKQFSFEESRVPGIPGRRRENADRFHGVSYMHASGEPKSVQMRNGLVELRNFEKDIIKGPQGHFAEAGESIELDSGHKHL